MKQIVVRLSIIGPFSQWPDFQKYCDDSISDASGVSVGIVSRLIKTDLGTYPVKFILFFLGDNIYHHIRPINRYKVQEIKKEGFETVLNKLGKKTIINIHLKGQNEKIMS
jgi:hypothetical protein